MKNQRFQTVSVVLFLLGCFGFAVLHDHVLDSDIQIVHAQPTGICTITGTYTATGVSVILDNRKSGCYQWRVSYNNTGFSALSIQLEQAPNANGVPGSWAAFTGATVVTDGANPSTNTNSAIIGIHSGAAFVRLRLVTVTGTGSISYQFWGANSTSNIASGATGSTGATGATGSNQIAAVNAAITASSLGSTAVCALHTDTGCGNATDATTANCPAGTLTAACTFSTSITIPANTLGSTIGRLNFSVGTLATATIPTVLVEIYLDTVRVYAGTASTIATGTRNTNAACVIGSTASGISAPLFASCNTNGALGVALNFSANVLNTNTAPAISIDTTISHVMKVSTAYSAATTGNLAWLYGMSFSRDGVGLTGATGATGATGTPGLLSATITLNTAQITAMSVTGVQIIAAPGSGNLNKINNCTFNAVYAGFGAFTGGGTMGPYYTAPNTAQIASSGIAPALLTSISANQLSASSGSMISVLSSVSVNAPIVIGNTGAPFVGGTGSSMIVTCSYSVIAAS